MVYPVIQGRRETKWPFDVPVVQGSPQSDIDGTEHAVFRSHHSLTDGQCIIYTVSRIAHEFGLDE